VQQVSRIGMDTSKQIFRLHGVDAAETGLAQEAAAQGNDEVFRGVAADAGWYRSMRQLPPPGPPAAVVWASGKLIPPQFVKPYVKRNKNDTADAEAICEAMSRPTTRFVPVKTAEQQAALMLVGMRERLIHNRTQLSNVIRGYAAEFGVTVSKGLARIEELLERVGNDEALPALVRELFALHGKEYTRLNAELEQIEARLMAWHRADACSQRLAQIPGIGPIGASMLVMKTPAPETIRSGRHFAAWLGLTPKDHSTAGKSRLGGITRAGDEALRSVLVVGSTSVLRRVRQRGTGSPWLIDLLKRKPPKLAAVALANKTLA
jgi:transposase